MREFYHTQRVTEGWNGPNVQDDLGGYRCEYMGSAEYEFGAVPQSFRALRDAKDLEVDTFPVAGREVTAVWIKSDGNPADDLNKWVEGGCRAKESPHLLDVLSGNRDEFNDTVIWWSLDDNVIFGMADAPHIQNIIKWLEARRNAS